MKRLGMSRGDDQQRRAEAVVKQLTQTYPDAKTIDFTRFTETGDGKGRWWVDSRASNDFQTVSTLVLVGAPCRNLDDLKAEFTCLYGRVPNNEMETVRYPIKVNNPLPDDVEPYFEMEDSVDIEFREFVRRRILADIHQGIGRLRSHRRSGEQLKVYFVADYALDISVTLVKASDLTPEAAGKVERMELAIKRAVADLKARGLKITQQAIATLIGKSQQYVSKFRVLLQTLFSDFNSKSSKNLDPPPDVGEQEAVVANVITKIATQPPEIILETLNEAFFDWLKPNQWQRVWDLLGAEVQVRILQCLILVLPPAEFAQLRKVVGP